MGIRDVIGLDSDVSGGESDFFIGGGIGVGPPDGFGGGFTSAEHTTMATVKIQRYTYRFKIQLKTFGMLKFAIYVQ